MLDISFAELIVILLAIIIFVAPKNLPTVGRAFGKTIRNVKVFFDDIKNEIDTEARFNELKKIENEIKKRSKNS